MDLDPAKTLLAAAVATAATPGQRFVWGRWSGTALYLEDAPDTPIDAGNVVNAAGPLMPGQLVLCLVEAKPHRITIIGPPAQPTSGSTGRGSWWRSPDGLQICTIRTTSVPAATAPYGDHLHQGRWEWVFPIPFIDRPTVTCTQWQWSTGASWGTVSGDASTHSALLRGLDDVPRTVADPLVICATAIGRWRN
nr:MAG TPA: hypothetical protein [Caudoviricetes sp.]